MYLTHKAPHCDTELGKHLPHEIGVLLSALCRPSLQISVASRVSISLVEEQQLCFLEIGLSYVWHMVPKGLLVPNIFEQSESQPVCATIALRRNFFFFPQSLLAASHIPYFDYQPVYLSLRETFLSLKSAYYWGLGVLRQLHLLLGRDKSSLLFVSHMSTKGETSGTMAEEPAFHVIVLVSQDPLICFVSVAEPVTCRARYPGLIDILAIGCCFLNLPDGGF